MEDAGMFSKRDAERIANTVMAYERRGTTAPPIQMPSRPLQRGLRLMRCREVFEIQTYLECDEYRYDDAQGYTGTPEKVWVRNEHMSIAKDSFFYAMKLFGELYVVSIPFYYAQDYKNERLQFLGHGSSIASDPDFPENDNKTFRPLRWYDIDQFLTLLPGWDPSRQQFLQHDPNQAIVWGDPPPPPPAP
jgi:hypothetical protein